MKDSNVKKFNTEWLRAEDIPNLCPFFAQIWLNCFVDNFDKHTGRAYKKISAIFKDYHLWYFFDKKDADIVGSHLVNKFLNEPEFMQLVNRNIIKYSDILRTTLSKYPETNLDKLSNNDLLKLFKEHEKLHTEYYQWGWIPVAADMFCGNLTNAGKEILKNYKIPASSIEEALMILTQPITPSLIKIENDEMIKIGIEIQNDKKQLKLIKNLYIKFQEQEIKKFGLYTHSPEYEEKFEKKVSEIKNKIRPDILNKLQEHYSKFFYTKFLFTEEQGVYSFDYYVKLLVKTVNNQPNLKKEIDNSIKEAKKIEKEKQNLINKFKISKKHQNLFLEWGNFMVTKIYRRYAQIYALYKMVPIIEEIGKRFNLSIKETKFMTFQEIKRGLLGAEIDKKEIKKRINFSLYFADKNYKKFYSGLKAKNLFNKYLKINEDYNLKEIKGQCGCRGMAKGLARIINIPEDMQKMKLGDILVSISTQPDLLPAMKKAAAFVTEQGGVTSHAAIVARELKTPCVIGTKIATKVIKDGDLIEVDADIGVVKILN